MPVSKRTKLAAQIAAAHQKGTGKYLTTVDSCSCPDHQYRQRICKHMTVVRENDTIDVTEEGDRHHPLCQICGAPWCDGDHSGDVPF